MLTAEPQALTVKEAAAMLRLDEETTRRLLAAGLIKGARGPGKRSHWRTTTQAVADYLAGETTDVASLPAACGAGDAT